MPRLIIAEKPSLGRAIAAALPKPHKNLKGYIETGNGDVVTWCIGHLLEQVEPDAYDEKYKQWRLEHLPIVPEQWKLRPRKSASAQLTVVRKLVKQFEQIVHAGDPDREGQLLVDEVFGYLKVPAQKRETIQRLLISDLNLPAVKKALGQLKSNKEFMALSVSALARSRADWLYGMNMSRAYTLIGKQAGYNGVLSVGRVQSPVLGLVVRRDEEISNFVPHPYFQLDAIIPYEDKEIRARWQPSDACAPWQDEQGRVLNRKLAENVAGRIAGQPAVVKDRERKITKQNAPLPYSLSALQIDAAKRFNMSAAQVLSVCQALYEQHKVITYPRSDCRYLPQGHFKQAADVANAVAATASSLSKACEQADLSRKSKAWNDKKVDAHHAIIPTSKAKKGALSGDELKIYELIARQYLMQFYPPAQFAEGKLVFDIAGGEFVAKGKALVEAGWRALIGKEADEKTLDALLPDIEKNSQLLCERGEIKDCMTEPPKAFTEATLLQAMTGIGRFVQDASLKAILRETDGLGTEATRAGILDLLFKRGLLNRQGKAIHASESGKGLVNALPEIATYPDMTAHWERQLQDMSERKLAYKPFMDALTEQVGVLISSVKTSPVPDSLRHLPAAPTKKKGWGKKRTTRRYSKKTPTSGAKE